MALTQTPKKTCQKLSQPKNQPSVYNFGFWMCYGANASLVTANCIMFRYIEFVRFHEPLQAELYLGLIVGVGSIGAVCMRLFQGQAFDRYGARSIWLLSLLLFIGATLSHFLVTTVHGPLVFLIRVSYMCSLCGALAGSMVYITRRIDPIRMAEMIGTLGTSGFVGMLLGPIIGDWLFLNEAPKADNIRTMFLLTALMGAISFIFTWLATKDEQVQPIKHRRPPPMLWLLKRYFPGPILLVGIAMGMGIGIPMNFLADYVSQHKLDGISSFFITYATVAFVVRILIRSFPQRFGYTTMIVTGFITLNLSYLTYWFIASKWDLVYPALLGGIAHAFLFPSIVAGGGTAFPERYRGLGTTLMLGTIDVGFLIGAPLAGVVLNQLIQAEVSHPYPWMFTFLSGLLTLMVIVFVLLSLRKKPTH